MLKWLDALEDDQGSRGGEVDASAQTETERQLPDNADALPELLEAIRHLVDPDELAELRDRFDSDPEAVTALCHFLLTAPPGPTLEQVEDLGRLIVRLASLENWPHDKLMDCLDQYRRMAPARVVEQLNHFLELIAAAEAKPVGH